MTFLEVFWASRARIWMKIGGNRAQAFPDPPIQPRNLDFNRKIEKITEEMSKKLAENFFIREFFYSP